MPLPKRRQKHKGDEAKGPKRSDDEPVAAERNTKGTHENCAHGRSQKKRRMKEEKKLENEPCKEAESVQSADDNVCHVCKDADGSMSGKHCDDDWLQCNRCCHWFHKTCAEEYGMVDKTDYMWELFLADVSSPIPHSFCLKS